MRRMHGACDYSRPFFFVGDDYGNRIIMHDYEWSRAQPRAGMGVPRGVRTRHVCMILIAKGEGTYFLFGDTPQGVF